MKKISFVFILIAIHLVVFAGEKATIKGESSFWFVSMKFKGSYGQIGEKMKVFIDEFFKQGLTPQGPPVSIFHNIPRLVKSEKELMWDLGFIVKKGTKAKRPLRAHTIKFPKTAKCLHVGPYEKLGETYKRMVEFLEKEGYKTKPPVINRYIDNPDKVKDKSKLKTEMLVGITKSKRK
jgi:effector-binding domain-containing protein